MSLNPEADTWAFVRVLAASCETYDGSIIRTDTPENTVAGLIKAASLHPILAEFLRLFHGICNALAGPFLVLNEF